MTTSVLSKNSSATQIFTSHSDYEMQHGNNYEGRYTSTSRTRRNSTDDHWTTRAKFPKQVVYPGMKGLLEELTQIISKDVLVPVFAKNRYDSVSDLHAFLRHVDRTNPQVKETFAKFAYAHDFTKTIDTDNGDECLGLSLQVLYRIQKVFSSCKTLQNLFGEETLDEHGKPIKKLNAETNIVDCTEDEELTFDLSYKTSETEYKIRSFIAGALSNQALPYFHFFVKFDVERTDLKTKNVESLKMVLDPGECMTKPIHSFSADFLDDQQKTSGRIATIHQEDIQKDYYKWLDDHPDWQKEIQQSGFLVEGKWRGLERKFIACDKPLSLSELRVHHQALFSFQLCPKMITFDAQGQIASFITFDWVQFTVKISCNGKETYLKSEQFTECLTKTGYFPVINKQHEIDATQVITRDEFLESLCKRPATQRKKEKSALFKKFCTVQEFATAFVSEMIEANNIRPDVIAKIFRRIDYVNFQLAHVHSTREKTNVLVDARIYHRINNKLVLPPYMKVLNERYKAEFGLNRDSGSSSPQTSESNSPPTKIPRVSLFSFFWSTGK